MPRRRWSETPRRWVLFVLVTVVPFVALTWLTVVLVGKDRAREALDRQDRVERAADRVVAASQQRLAELEAALQRFGSAVGQAGVPTGAALVVADRASVSVVPPGALAFIPVVPPAPDAQTFAEGERYEYRDEDLLRAVGVYTSLANSHDDGVRAGALLRLARTQRKANRIDSALESYRRLASLGGVTVADRLPAAVLALAGQCDILAAGDRRQELAAVSQELLDGLHRGTWAIGPDEFHFYLSQAHTWRGDAGDPVEALEGQTRARAFAEVYEQWISGGQVPSSRWLVADGRPALAAASESNGQLRVLVAGAAYLQDAWRDLPDLDVVFTDATGRPLLGQVLTASPYQAVRASDTTRLPWIVRVASSGESTADDGRRRLVLTGMAMMLLLVAGSTYFAARSVSRELAVARLQSDFVAAVSHEFRTPLASVRHLSDLLAQGRVVEEADRQRSYQFLSRESERLERLVEELLDFGRLEGGAYPFRFEPIDAADLVRHVAGEFEEKVAARGYRIDLDLAADSALVHADREAVTRALWNLLDNAVKYSPDAKVVRLSLGVEANGTVVIAVHDDGIGIPSQEQPLVFQKFVRGSNSRDRQVKGTGIGLAMVRHIMDAHRGDVSVRSEPGHGSTFFLRFPKQTFT